MYHAHVYFDPEQTVIAERFRQQIAHERRDVLAMFGLVPRLVGPHLKPMFELHFRNNQHGLVEWLDAHRGSLSVLIHPVSGDDAYDHQDDQILWLGEPLGLNRTIFR
ncbi:4,5-dioxygenase [Vibrio mimicus]|uniref:DOPA 4,5-dioxygenase family protein n=1 Tax=Vibrio mimicus TaxID=674 RepID=UPI0002BA599F|nr:DOPA 4,5-dioxygenase family protein [Vibrio mimicus]EMB48432.1 Aromatic ring-cleaving dioxygenase [Vibrio mimicus CAIM 602]MBY7675827.1 4,5-dioxygenase [Vibrio mimicus]MBY7727634.1 4,5-dioxygenase [Vibrio mimicus]TXY29167.1 4,5-dioxygenase [Vibrio mimicus]SUP09004.1 DOPA 4,5-dioxygenase [Vibrio mimicus]